MALTYFSNISDISVNGISMKNLCTRYNMISDSLTGLFDNIKVTDNDTPEIVAQKVYGDKRYFWIVLLSNNIVDFFYDWPLNSDELILYANKSFSEQTGVTLDEYVQSLNEVNEAKRFIKVLKRDYLSDFIYKIMKLK